MRIQGQFEGSYPAYAQSSVGGPTFPVFPTIADTAGQTNPNARQQFGDALVDKFGNVYVYVRFSGAAVVGDVLRQAVSNIGDVPAAGTISASTTTRQIFSSITTTIDEHAIGSFLASDGTTTFVKRIKGMVAIGANTTFILSRVQVFHGIGKYDGDELATTPTTGEPVTIIRPYNVLVCGAAAAVNIPVGVALCTVAAASASLMQVSGIGTCKNTTGIVAGGLAIAGAAGVVVPPTGTPTAYEIAGMVGIAKQASSLTGKVAVQLNLLSKF